MFPRIVFPRSPVVAPAGRRGRVVRDACGLGFGASHPGPRAVDVAWENPDSDR